MQVNLLCSWTKKIGHCGSVAGCRVVARKGEAHSRDHSAGRFRLVIWQVSDVVAAWHPLAGLEVRALMRSSIECDVSPESSVLAGHRAICDRVVDRADLRGMIWLVGRQNKSLGQIGFVNVACYLARTKKANFSWFSAANAGRSRNRRVPSR